MITIIPDTNYLIHSLDFVIQLHALLPNDYLLYIPLTVIQELDGLKNSNSQARRAIDYLYHSTHQLRIQRIDEVLDRYILNDDQILDCCLYTIRHLSPTVFFLCNDKNLVIKARAHGIPTISFYTRSAQELLESIKSESLELLQTLEPSMLNEYETLVYKDRDVEMIYDDVEVVDLASLLHQVHEIVVGCLSATISRIFEKAMGPDWQTSIHYSFPWDLPTIFQIITKDPMFRDLPVEMRDLNLVSMESVSKDIERSVRQGISLLTIGDLTLFLDQMESVLYLCDSAGLSLDRKRASALLLDIKSQFKYL